MPPTETRWNFSCVRRSQAWFLFMGMCFSLPLVLSGCGSAVSEDFVSVPTLAFNPIADIAFGVAPFAVNASSSSPGAITYSVISGPATFSGNLLNLTGAGTVAIQAAQAATAGFAAATMQTSFTVAKAANSVAFAPIAAHSFGDGPFTVVASSGSASTGAIAYTVISGPATISGATVTLTGVGVVTLGATQASDANYVAATTQVGIMASKATNTLAFAPISAHTFGDPPFAVSATSSTASTGAITYSVVSGPGTLSSNTLTLTGAGTVVLGATQASDANYAASTAQVSLTVSKVANTLALAFISPHTFGDSPFAVSATSSTASTGAITYSVVSGSGTLSGNMLTLTGAGTIVLQANQTATTDFAAASTQANLTVAKAADSITFVPIAGHSFGDAPFMVVADSSSASTGAITYTVISGAATVSDATVTLTGAGTVVLGATQAADGNYLAATVQVNVRVSKAGNTLAFSPIAARTFGDPPLAVSATSSTASTGAITYSIVSGPGTLSGNTLTMIGAGTVVLAAMQAADTNYISATAQVSVAVAKATDTLTFTVVGPHTSSDPPFPISATSSTPSTGAITYSVVSGPANISGNTVTLTGSGSLLLSATQASDTNYHSGVTQITVNVTNPNGDLTFNTIPPQTYGNPSFTVSASSNSAGAITYSVVSGPATMAGNSVRLTGAGEVVLEADQAANTTYPAQSAQDSFAVGKGSANLVFAPITSPIYGDPPFTVSASSASTGAVTYTIASGPATVSGNTVTLTGSGTVTITARQAADTNYLNATNQTSFTVAVPNTSSVGLIKHVVIVFQENVSFDHYFATYPVASNPPGEPTFTALPNTPSVDGLSTRLLTANPNSKNSRNGSGAINPFRLGRSNAATADQDHQYTAEEIAFDNGAMDLFPLSVGAADGPTLAPSGGTATTGLTMGYFDGNTVTGLWNYAQYFAMSDHFFGTTFGPSTVGAINLISGQTNGVVNDGNADGEVVADGYGGYTLISDPDATNDICANAASGIVHMTGKNIGDSLSAAGISWGFFAEGFDTTLSNPNGTTGCGRSHASTITGRTTVDYIVHHEPFQYYASTANPTHARPLSTSTIGQASDGRANHQYDTHDFFDALQAGNMPAVSFLKPAGYHDGHAGYSDPLDEQAFLVSTLNAIQESSFWNSTVVIIAYDDSDGWYDHEYHVVNGSATAKDAFTTTGKCADGTTALPGVSSSALHAQGRCGYGPRLPFVVVSPWAKPNYVDSTVIDQTSILHFIEDTFLNQQRIGGGSFDSISNPINSLFDFRRSTPQNLRVVLLDGTTGTVTSVH